MKKLLLLISLSALVISGCTNIEPGWTGLKINRMGSGKGVSKENVAVGTTFFMPGVTRIVKYPTFMQRVAWTMSREEGNKTNEELTFNTKDQIRVAMDASINYTLAPAAVPDFYTQFRADNIDTFTHGYLRDVSRNAVTKIGGEYNFEDLNGIKKEEFLARVETEINKSVSPYGVSVRQFSSIGVLRPPEVITAAVNAKAKSTQDAITAENQLRQIKAEAAKVVAKAEGEAAANRAKTASLDPRLMEWKRLEIEEERVAKWNGHYPQVVTSGTGTMFNLGLK